VAAAACEGVRAGSESLGSATQAAGSRGHLLPLKTEGKRRISAVVAGGYSAPVCSQILQRKKGGRGEKGR
jgi:hypothetical protein